MCCFCCFLSFPRVILYDCFPLYRSGVEADLLGSLLVGGLTAGAVVVGGPLALGAIGYTAGGIVAGSYAAGMMSAATPVAVGSTVAVLQSVGAAGISTATAAAAGLTATSAKLAYDCQCNNGC